MSWRDSGNIWEQGSEKALYATSSSAGTVSGTFANLPFVKESEFTDETEMKEKQDEGGNPYYMDGTRKLKWSMTFMERDDAAMMLAPTTMRGNYYAIFKELNSIPINTKYYYIYAPACKVKADLKFKLPGGEIPLEIYPQKVTSAVSIDVSTFGTNITKTSPTGTFTVPANSYYTIIEL